MTHQRKLDAIRGLASIVVLLDHSVIAFISRLTGNQHWLHVAFFYATRHAVLIFFLLSGHLITKSLLSNVRRNGQLDVREYLTARVVRIYPALIGTILIALFAGALIHGFGLHGSVSYWLPGDLFALRDAYSVTGVDVWKAFAMLDGMRQANGPLWTLCIEFRLYLIAMFLVMARFNRMGWLWLIVGLLFLGNDYATFRDYTLVATAWGMGSASVLLADKPARGWLAVFGLFGLSLYLDPYYAGMLSLCVLWVYLIFVRPEGANPPEWAVKTAGFSYSLYIIHFPMLLLMLSLVQPLIGNSMALAVAAMLTAIGLCLVAAYWFAKFFEDQPRFRAMLAKRLPSRQPSSV